jgi:hypothetical protein
MKPFNVRLLVALSLFFSSALHAQSYADPANAQQYLKDTTYRLVVIVPKAAEEKEMRPYTKNPEFYKIYCAALDTVNAHWVKAINEHWRMYRKPEFLSVDEVLKLQSLPREQRDNIYVLSYSWIQWGLRDIIKFMLEKSKSKNMDLHEIQPEGHQITAIGLYNFGLKIKAVSEGNNTAYNGLSETYKEVTIPDVCAIYEIGHNYPCYADFVFALNNMQELIATRAKDKKVKRTSTDIRTTTPEALRKKTLLIPELYVSEWKKSQRERSVSDKTIRENYPYPFKVVPFSEIDKVVRAKDDRYAIVFRSFWPSVPGTGTHWMFFWAVDAADCKTIYSFAAPFTSGFTYADRDIFTFYERRIQEMADRVEGKFKE